jgi:hypothetical protein
MHSFKNVRWTVEPIPVKDTVGVEAQLLTQKTLKEYQDNLMETIGRFQEKIDSITSEGKRLQLQEDLNFSKTCLEVCKEAFSQLSNQNYDEYCDQVNDGDSQLVGSMSVDVLLALCRDWYSAWYKP